jgi:hypothetical protein
VSRADRIQVYNQALSGYANALRAVAQSLMETHAWVKEGHRYWDERNPYHEAYHTGARHAFEAVIALMDERECKDEMEALERLILSNALGEDYQNFRIKMSTSAQKMRDLRDRIHADATYIRALEDVVKAAGADMPNRNPDENLPQYLLDARTLMLSRVFDMTGLPQRRKLVPRIRSLCVWLMTKAGYTFHETRDALHYRSTSNFDKYIDRESEKNWQAKKLIAELRKIRRKHRSDKGN